MISNMNPFALAALICLIVLSFGYLIWEYHICFFNRLLGKKPSAILGVGLAAKFSTSVISENLLFTTGLIAKPLKIPMMAAFYLLKPIIVGVFSRGPASNKDLIFGIPGTSKKYTKKNLI